MKKISYFLCLFFIYNFSYLIYASQDEFSEYEKYQQERKRFSSISEKRKIELINCYHKYYKKGYNNKKIKNICLKNRYDSHSLTYITLTILIVLLFITFLIGSFRGHDPWNG
jgi:hypothetical protein